MADEEPTQVFPDQRAGADSCYKCGTCDTDCPVAAVDEDFPGPKFQGPEQWRLERPEDRTIDPSISKCSNCMRCDRACPADVPLSEMHNRARAEYVEESVSRLSRRYLRDRLLANYGRLGRLGSRIPRLTNAVLSNRLAQWAARRFLGITDAREFPQFAPQSFRSWWAERGGPAVQSDDRRVAYFHGDYANYNTPDVGKALVRVFEHFGYQVAVPDQRCSGTPMFANGMLEDARRAARFNVETLSSYVDDGYAVVCSCTSCSMALRKEYPELFSFDETETVATNTWDALEYLRVNEDLQGALSTSSIDQSILAYHAPCHARNQGLATQTPELLSELSGAETADLGDSCSGMSGTYGWKAEHYETSMAIGDELFEHMADAPADAGLTECPTCAMQMEHGSDLAVNHTLEVLEAALIDLDGPFFMLGRLSS
ncbi:MAG: anaerobic glycerol-3-phosphate dehydrogenase subunit C [Natrialbaceae archaeon]|nr:anaerobic glycerol-3-phosphate dehydrogenase subunit C [Natrialbaceae archaeon]